MSGSAPDGDRESQGLIATILRIPVVVGEIVRQLVALNTELAGGVAVLTTLPTYTVAALPATASTSAQAYASNGRKPAEGPGAGTGVQVFYDGVAWRSVCDGTTVAA